MSSFRQAATIILEPLDIILSQIVAELNFDDAQGVLRTIGDAMNGAQRDFDCRGCSD
jgi:hypothetical protein